MEGEGGREKEGDGPDKSIVVLPKLPQERGRGGKVH